MLNHFGQAVFAEIVKFVQGPMGQIHNQKLVKEHSIEHREVLYPYQSTAVFVAFGWILHMIIVPQPL